MAVRMSAMATFTALDDVLVDVFMDIAQNETETDLKNYAESVLVMRKHKGSIVESIVSELAAEGNLHQATLADF